VIRGRTIVAAVGLIASLGTVTASGLTVASAHPDAPGTVHGHLRAVGGPPPGQSTPLPGHVYLRAHGHRVLTMTVHQGGRFHGSVPAGRYHAFGRSPRYRNNKARCQVGHVIHVRKYQIVHFTVACQEL
jgi:hypothetical protein